MNMNFVSQILLCLVLLIVQALVLNNIHLFGFATPLLYVYTVICMRRNFPRWAALVISFLLGLGIDIFSNTPGVAACSPTTSCLPSIRLVWQNISTMLLLLHYYIV